MVHPSRHIPGFMARTAEEAAAAPAKAKKAKTPRALKRKATRKRMERAAAPKPRQALVDQLKGKAT